VGVAKCIKTFVGQPGEGKSLKRYPLFALECVVKKFGVIGFMWLGIRTSGGLLVTLQ
jgi:hypothetical protein